MAHPLPFPIPLDRPLALLDMETTGLRVGVDRIVELAIIRLAPNGDVSERIRRFNPEMPIPPEASRIHGITDTDVAEESPFAVRARSLAQFLDRCDLGGFNLRRFDLPVLLAEFRRAGVPFDVRGRRLVDVQTIFHREEPRDLGAAVRFYLSRELEDAHSALADIRATAAVLSAQLEHYPELPRDLAGLHAYCDEVRPFETELDRWFVNTEEHGLVFRRGKQRDRPLSEVAVTNPDYLQWMVATDDMDGEVKDAVRRALEGTIPNGPLP
ncbi:MAG: 3'-5' exonuclease [Gemmatimonadetes bacterium]|nr:3'-5' exonuclease [Gemmatimonadota bacterium]